MFRFQFVYGMIMEPFQSFISFLHIFHFPPLLNCLFLIFSLLFLLSLPFPNLNPIFFCSFLPSFLLLLLLPFHAFLPLVHLLLHRRPNSPTSLFLPVTLDERSGCRITKSLTAGGNFLIVEKLCILDLVSSAGGG